MRSTLSLYLWLCLLAPPLAAWAQDAPRASEATGPLTLGAALELALAANPDLAAAGRELEAVDATIVQARTRPNPELSTLIEDTLGVTQTTTIQLNQPIELGGKREARIVAAERGRDGASLELDAKRAEIRAAVVAGFFEVLLAQEGLRLAQVSVDLAQRATGAAARRVNLNLAVGEPGNHRNKLLLKCLCQLRSS